MRIGANLLLNHSTAVQSYGYQTLRPLGGIQNAIDHLDAYECDEICITRPVRNRDTDNLLDQDIKLVKTINSSTPVSFGGGLRTTSHIEKLTGLPIERLHFSSAFIEKNQKVIQFATKCFGRQAIQCCLPITNSDNSFFILNSAYNKFVELGNIDFEFIDACANEIILIDVDNEGYSNTFNFRIIDKFKFNPNKTLISGGINADCVARAKEYKLTGVLVDNKVLHRENSILKLKHAKV